MKVAKMVWVELGEDHYPIRIFKSWKAASASGLRIGITTRGLAVCHIRRKLWVRCKGECEQCSSVITEQASHMHERVWRGRGGEISLANSVLICPPCHQYDHRSRKPRWGQEIKTGE